MAANAKKKVRIQREEADLEDFSLVLEAYKFRGYAITTIWARWVRLSMWLLFAVS